MPAEARDDDQPVERVDLRLTAPHRAERVTDVVGRALQVEHRAAPVEHPEVVDEHPSLAAHVDRNLFDDAETERLEQRHEGRQIDLPAGL
jgi:hypothetical protein